jgi:phenylalanyl-tRNA synthetase alpha chain
MTEQLDMIQSEALTALKGIHDEDALRAWYAVHLAKKSPLMTALGDLGKLPKEQRAQVGKRANEVKRALEAAYAEKEQAIQAEALARALKENAVDVTLPGRRPQPGRLHISTQTLRHIYQVFGEMGFQVYEAPDVETDEYNFGLLNMPSYHPARDMWDTFWLNKEGLLLRTHTSPGQIRAMREMYPNPVRVILPGKCYRYEQITARSEHQFYQIEGLAVGHSITLADLKGTMLNAARRLYGEDRQVRFRGSYFPFTEPSVEVDMNCILCNGAGCRVCKYTGWLEIAGSGMVHPVVLKNGGYDPNEWSGFAFGMGLERPIMLKYGIDDIRYFYGNDLRFLRQF